MGNKTWVNKTWVKQDMEKIRRRVMKPINSRTDTECLACSLIEYLMGDGVHPGWLSRRSHHRPARRIQIRNTPANQWAGETPMKESNYASPADCDTDSPHCSDNVPHSGLVLGAETRRGPGISHGWRSPTESLAGENLRHGGWAPGSHEGATQVRTVGLKNGAPHRHRAFLADSPTHSAV